MREVFIGREKELADLNAMYTEDKFHLFVLFLRKNAKNQFNSY